MLMTRDKVIAEDGRIFRFGANISIEIYNLFANFNEKLEEIWIKQTLVNIMHFI